MAARRRYNVESITRALEHHKLADAIGSFAPPTDKGVWRVHVLGMGQIELTTAQTYALCIGLAAGERAHKPLDPLGTQGVPS